MAKSGEHRSGLPTSPLVEQTRLTHPTPPAPEAAPFPSTGNIMTAVVAGYFSYLRGVPTPDRAPEAAASRPMDVAEHPWALPRVRYHAGSAARVDTTPRNNSGTAEDPVSRGGFAFVVGEIIRASQCCQENQHFTDLEIRGIPQRTPTISNDNMSRHADPLRFIDGSSPNSESYQYIWMVS